MNSREFHTAIVSLCREVSVAAKLDETRVQRIRDDVEGLRREADLLLDFALAYQQSGVRCIFEDSTGAEYHRGNFPEDANGRLWGKYLSVHELALAAILDRLDDANGKIDWDELIDDMRTEAVFLETVNSTAATATVANSTNDKQDPDGPDGPAGLEYWVQDGKQILLKKKLQPAQRKLAKLLLERLGDLPVVEVAVADAKKELTSASVEATRKHATNLDTGLRANCLPYAVTTDQDYISIKRLGSQNSSRIP